MNYRFESDVIVHEGEILNLITVFKGDEIITTTRINITKDIEKINPDPIKQVSLWWKIETIGKKTGSIFLFLVFFLVESASVSCFSHVKSIDTKWLNLHNKEK